MKIAIIGPSKKERLKEFSDKFEEIIKEIARVVLNDEIYLTPDRGSVSELLAKEYLENGGTNLKPLIPLEDTEFGYDWVNPDLAQNISCGTWRNQPESLNERTEIMICLGYSVGGMAEMAYSKWFNKKPIFVINELVSGQLPKDTVRDLDIKYISYKDLSKELSKIGS
ncbi:hypothetical protein GF378_02775 [Candidatus Pacearchaeota archaeon]|nr:hypothetical protein [Candidatus Pacearchaeota archaeon]